MEIQKNIVLVGFMGAGKSTTASFLSKHLAWPVVSTDEMIIKAEGRPINDIFRDSGEHYFRSVERRMVQEAAGREKVIIDCGGGVVLNPENMTVLRRTGVIFYLETSPAQVFERVKTETHRPLLKTPDPQKKIQELLDQRSPLYAQADHAVNTDGKTPKQVGQEILAILGE